jgi:hypothetical protein
MNDHIPEANLIKSKRCIDIIKKATELTPESFFKLPASKTGRYHPEDERSEGGLIIHTRRVMRVVDSLCHTFKITDDKYDSMLLAALLHDTHKCFSTDYSSWLDYLNKLGLNDFEIFLIINHDGRWSPLADWHLKNRPLEELSIYEILLHTADYLASRSYWKLDLSNNDR